MHRLSAVVLTVVTLTAPALVAAPASAEPVAGPPFVASTHWAKWGDLSTLRVYPTASARSVSTQPGTVVQADEAWAEVLAQAPDADIPGMRAQFMCHWQFAELVEPGKTSWNLEPWRPEVDEATMVATRCNPGGTEEPF